MTTLAKMQQIIDISNVRITRYDTIFTCAQNLTKWPA